MANFEIPARQYMSRPLRTAPVDDGWPVGVYAKPVALPAVLDTGPGYN